MRRHYESLNYTDGAPGDMKFRFVRTQSAQDGYLKESNGQFERTMNKKQVEALRDMLNEVLEDWK
jgi:hypothetical protein